MKGKHVAVPPQFAKKGASDSGFPNKPPAVARSNSAAPSNNVNQSMDPMTAALMKRKMMGGGAKKPNPFK